MHMLTHMATPGGPNAALLKDSTGQRFGKLVAVERVFVNGRTHYRCTCDCGGEKLVIGSSLRSGHVASCGCLRPGFKAGQRFNRLTVIGEDGGYLVPNIMCRCDCGTEKLINKWRMKQGKVKSCGCKRRDNKNGYKHGMSYHPDFNLWMGMVRRCTKPSDHGWYKYGGRGITVCERWSGNLGFKNFIEDMGPRPSKQHSLDRIDVNGNYEPGNVKWSTAKEQNQNRRSSLPRQRDLVKAAMDRVLSSKSESFTKLEVLSILRVLRFNLVGE